MNAVRFSMQNFHFGMMRLTVWLIDLNAFIKRNDARSLAQSQVNMYGKHSNKMATFDGSYPTAALPTPAQCRSVLSTFRQILQSQYRLN